MTPARASAGGVPLLGNAERVLLVVKPAAVKPDDYPDAEPVPLES